MDFETLSDFDTLYNAYKNCRVGKRHNAGCAQYEANAIHATQKLSHILKTKSYKPSKFETFRVYEPKERLVRSCTKQSEHAIIH